MISPDAPPSIATSTINSISPTSRSGATLINIGEEDPETFLALIEESKTC